MKMEICGRPAKTTGKPCKNQTHSSHHPACKTHLTGQEKAVGDAYQDGYGKGRWDREGDLNRETIRLQEENASLRREFLALKKEASKTGSPKCGISTTNQNGMR